MQTMVVVKRPVTIALLLLTTAGIAAATLWMSGKSYSKVDPIPFEDLRHLTRRIAHQPVSTRFIALIVVPIVANILLFVPWGFFLFIALHHGDRPSVQIYILTLLLGFTYACVIEALQYFLPTRVADVNDIIWNTTGVLAGAVLAHMRVHVRFEFD